MVPDHLKRFARAMRHEPAPAEKILWRGLRSRLLAGFKFRRQHPLPPYILDFYCHSAGVVVELDGDSHVDPQCRRADADRQAVIEAAGLVVLRFWNPEVFDNTDGVLETIYQTCLGRAEVLNPLSPCSEGERGSICPDTPQAARPDKL